MDASPIGPSDHVLSATLDDLLVHGGDSRMHLNVATGLNKYGCAPRVRQAVAFGNCTASSLSPNGLEGARSTLDRLRAAARRGGDDAVRVEAETMFGEYRKRFRAVMRLEDVACDIAFCPSGTDAEMLALALARGTWDGPFLNVVSGPSEVGSGTTLAAAGQHFDRHVPAGHSREPGQPIDGELGSMVRVDTVRLRAADGRLLEPAELDEQADGLVRGACAEGARVLLHVVTHSKTGVYAPSFDKAAELRDDFKHDEAVAVVLDAAQGRLSRRSVRAALELGYMVLMTGSKFYGGPPFSGILLVPPGLRPEDTGLGRLTPGMSDYLTSPELPRSWGDVLESVPSAPNVGLVLRWGAALAQMESYYETPSEHRRTVMRSFEELVPQILGASEKVHVVPVSPIRERDSLRFLEAATTVFPFFVDGNDDVPMGRDDLKRLFWLLNRDMSGAMPGATASQKALLGRQIHIGQPVLLSGGADEERSVLRVALGGPMITKVATDESIGATFDVRLEWLTAQIEMLRAKIELLVQNFDTFGE